MSHRAHAGQRRQRGIAAVELALSMPVLMLMLVLPLFMGRILWHYTVTQKAAHDAARYVASASAEDMHNAARAGYVTAMARRIIDAELAELTPGSTGPLVLILCNGGSCGGIAVPATVTVNIQMQIDDIFFPNVTNFYGFNSIPFTVNVTFPFVGI